MAFFKFRWPGQSQEEDQQSSRRSARSAQTESVESLRRRARHRLIGAAVLVLLGVVGFPLLFDTQPRPVPVDVPIEIPDRNESVPMVVPGDHTSTPAHGAGTATTPSSRSPQPPESSLSEGEEFFTPSVPVAPAPPPVTQVAPPAPAPVPPPEPKPVPKPEPKPEVKKPEPKPEPKPEVKKPEPKPEVKKPEPKPEPKRSQDSDAERARALLEGRTAAAKAEAPAAAKQEGKFIIQVGAFGDPEKANEVRQKLAGAGLKAYTQTVNASAGKVTRVRVGPFNGRADADKAAARIKGLGLPAAVQPG